LYSYLCGLPVQRKTGSQILFTWANCQSGRRGKSAKMYIVLMGSLCEAETVCSAIRKHNRGNRPWNWATTTQTIYKIHFPSHSQLWPGRGEVPYYTPTINNNKFFMSFQGKSLHRTSCC